MPKLKFETFPKTSEFDQTIKQTNERTNDDPSRLKQLSHRGQLVLSLDSPLTPLPRLFTSSSPSSSSSSSSSSSTTHPFEKSPAPMPGAALPQSASSSLASYASSSASVSLDYSSSVSAATVAAAAAAAAAAATVSLSPSLILSPSASHVAVHWPFTDAFQVSEEAIYI